MAFPGNYNFNYYRGDTFQFNIYPKNSDGTEFPSLSTYTASFTMSTDRGSAGFANQVAGVATVSANAVSCSITPAVGILLDASQQYVYDVEITKTVTDPDTLAETTFTYTLLTGSISITDHITGATPEIE